MCFHIFARCAPQKLSVSFQDFLAFCHTATRGTDQATLCTRLHISRQTWSGRCAWFLASPPSPQEIATLFPPACVSPLTWWVYGYDGKWLGRSPVLIIHRDVTHKETLWWSVALSESRAAVQEDLVALCSILVPTRPCGAVTDGKPGIGTLIKTAFHLVAIQRCLVHITRELKTLLPLHSPLNATQALRTIALTLSTIHTEGDRTVFFLSLIIWEQQYGELLKQRTIPPKGSGVKQSWWYTHGNLRRAWRLLNLDSATVFAFLDNPAVPATNNSLEGVNRHLHRRVGMGKGKQLSFMLWKLALSRVTTQAQKKQLWDVWKRRLYHS